MKIKFIHAVVIFILIMVVLVVFGSSSGDWPGVPGVGKKTVIGYMGISSWPLCTGINAYIEGLSLRPDLCFPEAGDPDGDIIISVYKGQTDIAMYSMKKKSECNWVTGCGLHKQFNLCLSPGIYKVKIQWYFCGTLSEDEKTITVV